MKYNDKRTKEKLDNVPLENRVFIYDASIILEFLNQTLMPLEYFKGKEVGQNEALSVGDLYDYYKMFRQAKDYTSPIETRYKFSTILRRLNLAKNGWEFKSKRVGRAQIVYFYPAVLRTKVDIEDRKKFPPFGDKSAQTHVEVSKEDHEEPIVDAPLDVEPTVADQHLGIIGPVTDPVPETYGFNPEGKPDMGSEVSEKW